MKIRIVLLLLAIIFGVAAVFGVMIYLNNVRSSVEKEGELVSVLVAAEIIPAAAVVRSIKGRLAGVIPEVSMQLGMIGQTLDSLVLEVGEATGTSWSAMATGEDAEKILMEASTIAEQRVRDGFPDLPSTSTAEKGVNTS